LAWSPKIRKTIGSEQLASFTTWLKQNNRQAFLREFAGARNATCYAALDDVLGYIDQHTDVWLGWTY
jgi:endoglucanase